MGGLLLQTSVASWLESLFSTLSPSTKWLSQIQKDICTTILSWHQCCNGPYPHSQFRNLSKPPQFVPSLPPSDDSTSPMFAVLLICVLGYLLPPSKDSNSPTQFMYICNILYPLGKQCINTRPVWLKTLFYNWIVISANAIHKICDKWLSLYIDSFN